MDARSLLVGALEPGGGHRGGGGPPPPPPPPLPPPHPPSFHSRVDAWWWGSGASLYDERRAVAPACRPYASTAANARALAAARVFLAVFIFAGATQDSAFWLIDDTTQHHGAYVSNHAQWVAAAYLVVSALLSVGTAAAVRAPRSALAKALLPRSAAVLSAPAPALLPLAGLCLKRAATLLLAIALTFNVVTTLIFWLLLRKPNYAPLELYLSIFTHGVCLVATAADFLLSAHRLPTRLLCAVMSCGFFYLCVNITWALGVGRVLYGFLTWKNGASWLWAGLCLLILVGAFFGWQTVGHVCRDAVGRTPACARGGAAPGAGAAAALAGAAGGAGAGAPKVDAAPAAGGDDEAAWAAAFPAPDNLDDAALAVPCELVTCAACATACPCCRPSSGAGAGVGAAGGAA